MLDRFSPQVKEKVLLRKVIKPLRKFLAALPVGRQAQHGRSRMWNQFNTIKHAIQVIRVGAKFVFICATFAGFNEGYSQTTAGPFRELFAYENPLRAPQVVGAGLRPTMVDLDNDGDYDLVVGERIAPGLRYFENTGTSTQPRFVERIGNANPFDAINAIGTPYTAFADIDADGDQDLFMGDEASPSSIRYFVNSGSQSFTQQSGPWNPTTKAGNPFNGIAPGSDSNQMTFADLDNDGDLDAGISHPSPVNPLTGNFHFFVNTGNGSFSLNQNILNFDNPITDPQRLDPTFADIDSDGDLDLLIANPTTDEIRYFANDGNNNFIEGAGNWDSVAKTGNPFNAISYTNLSIDMADLDNDGDSDLMVGAGLGGDFLLFYKNQGNGIFVSQTDLSNPFGGISDVNSINLVPLTNAAGLEPVVGHNTDNLRVFEKNSGTYVINSTHPVSNIASLNAVPVFEDVDKDADLDIVMGVAPMDAGSSIIRYFKNNAGAYAQQGLSVFSPLTIPSQPVPAFVDIDGDGDRDLFIGEEFGTIKYYRNDAGSYIAQAAASNPLSGIALDPSGAGDRAEINFQDLDGDGDFDLFASDVAASSPGGVLYFENTGTKTVPNFATAALAVNHPFGAHGITGQGTSLLGFGDVDSDGDLDFFYTKSQNNLDVLGYVVNENSAPIIATPTSVNFDLGVSKLVSSTLTLTDDNDDNPIATGTQNDKMLQATVAISPFSTGNESLSVSGLFAGMNQSFNTSTGVLTISGLASATNYQTVLRTLSYRYEDNGTFNGAARTLTIRVLDIDQTISTTNTKQVTLNPPASINNAPVVTLNSISLFYTGTSLSIAPDITVADVENAISSATIQLAGFQANEDLLTFVGVNGITGTFSSTTGLLTLTGAATPAAYEGVIRSIQYVNQAATRTNANRTVTIVVNDGTVDSNTINVTIAVPNQAPVLTLTQTTREFSGPDLVIDGALTVTDSDDANLSSARIAIGTGFKSGEDELIFANQNGITGTFNASTGVLQLTGSASLVNYQAALRSITYRNTAPDRTMGNRTLELYVQDEVDKSTTASLLLTVPNVAPAVTLSKGTSVYNSPTLILDDEVGLSDSDNANLVGASVKIVGSFNANEDELLFTSQNGITGTFNSTTGSLQLSGTATISNYQLALRTVRYRNNALDRTNTNRTIHFSVSDGTNFSTTASLTLEVPNIAPAITLSKAATAYDGTNTVIDDALVIADSDDVNLVGASVAITDFLLTNEDQLIFADQNGITGSYDVSTGILQLSGTSSLLNYQNALRSVAYQNTSANRTPGTKKISVQVNDGQTPSNLASLDIAVSNDAPAISSTLGATFYLGNNLTINNSIVIVDSDNGTMQSAVVTISSGYRISEDQLLFNNQNGITGTFLATTGTLQLSGAASLANYQTALRSIQFRNTATVPNATARVITFSVNDGNTISNLLVTRIDMNQPPVVNAAPQTIEAGGDVTFSMSSILSDPDNNLDPSTLSINSLAGASVSIQGDQIIIDYSTVQDFKGTDVLTISICDVGGQCKSQEVAITLESDVVVYNGVSPNGDQRNDYLKVRYLPSGSKVYIYNRWGDLVFEMLDYKNDQPGKRFEGLNNDGNELASGTYFYKIEIPNQKELTGYLVLKR